MQLKRLAVCIAASFLVSTFSLATGAQAAGKRFSLTGGGGQTHIGNGLMIPIQQAAVNSVTTGTMFPSLLIPVAGAPIVSGTITKPIMTAGTKMGYQRQLKVPIGVFKKDAAKTTVGVKFSNPTVFAVATNLSAKWPAAPAVFSTGVAVGGASSTGGTGLVTITGFGGSLTYSNALGTRFGGAARFAIGNGDPSTPDLYPQAPVTVYIKINAVTPPCTFPIPQGTVACAAGIILAHPTGTGAIGGRKATTVTSPGGKVTATGGNPGIAHTAMSNTFPATGKNVVGVKLGTAPLGTLSGVPAFGGAKAARINWAPLPTNMAMSQGGPWTTGMVVIANPAALPATETWILSGKDGRTAGGNGTIQMVAGSVSSRPASGPNANRGWVSMTLGTLDTSEVPSMSLTGLATTVALILLAFGYTMRRRIFA